MWSPARAADQIWDNASPRDQLNPRLYIGIDAGGSGTRAALAGADGGVLAVGSGGASNHLSGAAGRRRLGRALHAALSPLLASIGDQECVIHAGVTGIGIPGKPEGCLEAIHELLPRASVHLTNDAPVAVVGALADGAGVGVLAGTGSIALARTTDGREARAGGYGYLLGDEGSAFSIARTALARALLAVDGRGPGTRLTEMFQRQVGLDDVLGLPGWVYGGPHEVERLAKLAPLVSRAADEGDEVAMLVLEEAGEGLAQLAAAAARMLWPDSLPDAVPVATCGRVWQAGAHVRVPFERALLQRLPHACVILPALPPLGGALLLAMRADGLDISPETLERLGHTLGGDTP
jgi:N-acetylglucosamine kinase